MKRHPALHPLSRDHHNVLVHARRLQGLDARHDAPSARSAFLSYFDGVLRQHFAEEDLILAPLVDDVALRQRLIGEHADLARRAEALRGEAAGQADLGERLRLHVRFEEDDLFPHLESTLGEGDFASIAVQGTRHRQATRPASLEGGEACYL